MNPREYLGENKSYVLVAALAFTVSVVAGYFYSLVNPGFAEMGMSQFQDSFSWITELHPMLILGIVFLNNAIKAFFALVLGVAFGLIPLGFLTLNGVMMGLVAYHISNTRGWAYFLAGVGPHGVIEIPMLILSAGIGIRLGYRAFDTIRGKQVNLKREVKRAIVFYAKIILPLLLLASAVEAILTPLVLSLII